MENDWIWWSGGACPEHDDVEVEVRLRDGQTKTGKAAGWSWEREPEPCGSEIVAYRVIRDPGAGDALIRSGRREERLRVVALLQEHRSKYMCKAKEHYSDAIVSDIHYRIASIIKGIESEVGADDE